MRAESWSRPAIIRWLAAIRAAGNDAAKQEQALHDLLRVAFPAKWSYVLRGDPVLTILNLGLETRERVLESFFAFALPDEMMPAGQRKTSGPSEPGSSLAAPTLSAAVR